MAATARDPRGAGHKTAPLVPFDAQLAAMAPEREAVFALSELLRLGLGARAIRKRVANGRLHRVHQAVYSLVPVEMLTVRGRYRAAVLACTGSRHTAALSHRSAADLHGLRTCHRRTVEVIVPGRSTHRHEGIQVHRSINLVPADSIVIDGIAVTTVARTQLDLAAVVPPRGVERALDQSEILGTFDLRALEDQLQRNPAHPGTGRLRATLNRYRIGSAVTDSELEEAFLALCAAHGFPMPDCRAAIDPRDGGVLLRPDAVWRDRKLVVEVDGEQVHRTHRAFHDDRARDQRLVAAGWRVIRTTREQLIERSQELAAVLQQLLR